MRAVEPRVSFAELSAWPADGRRWELYGGEPISVPAPNWRHQRVVVNLVVALREYEHRAGGAVVAAPFDVVLSDYDVVQPDVMFFGARKRATLNPLEAAYVAPDLAVEVLSRSTEARDRGRKLALLARYGLPEYWLVDAVEQTVEVRTSSPPTVQIFESTHRLTSATLPDLAFDVDELFRP
jgi:Uma2 family endonuclease